MLSRQDKSPAFVGYDDALLHHEVVVQRKSIFEPIMTGAELTALLDAHGAKQPSLVLTLKLTTVEAAVKDKPGVTRNVVNKVLRPLGSSPRLQQSDVDEWDPDKAELPKKNVLAIHTYMVKPEFKQVVTMFVEPFGA
jgi:hypothetical protein